MIKGEVYFKADKLLYCSRVKGWKENAREIKWSLFLMRASPVILKDRKKRKRD